MKKKITFFILSILILVGSLQYVSAQNNAGINSSGTTPDHSAQLDLNTGNTWSTSNGKGFLMPCLTTLQMDAIVTPYPGLEVYNTDCKIFDYWNGSAWIPVSPALPTPGPITGQVSICPDASSEVYSIPAVAGATSYSWSVPTGATITGPSNTTSITVNFGTTAGNICVTASDNCGNSNPYCTTVYFNTSNSWAQLAPTGGPPTVRQSARTVWDNNDNVMLMFGGDDNGTYFNDVWSYNPITNVWTKFTAPTGTAPSVRMDSYVVWDMPDKKMLVFGGGNGGTYYNDLFSFDPVANAWATLSPTGGPPGQREQGAAVWDATDNEMIIWSGYNGGRLNDLWIYKPSTNIWTSPAITGGPPAARNGSSGVWDATDKQMIIWGGYNGPYYSDTWAYSPSNNTWTSLNPPSAPPGRDDEILAWDPVNNTMYMNGGEAGGPSYNDLWAYSIPANTWTQLSPCGATPSIRWENAVIWDPNNNTMYMFGGYDPTTHWLNDLWQYNP